MYKDFKESYKSSSYNVDGKILEILRENVDYTMERGRIDIKKRKAICTAMIDEEKVFSYFADNKEISDIELVEGMLAYVDSPEAKEKLDSVEKLIALALESKNLTEEQKQSYFNTFVKMNEEYNYIIDILKHKETLQKSLEVMKKLDKNSTPSTFGE